MIKLINESTNRFTSNPKFIDPALRSFPYGSLIDFKREVDEDGSVNEYYIYKIKNPKFFSEYKNTQDFLEIFGISDRYYKYYGEVGPGERYETYSVDYFPGKGIAILNVYSALNI